MKVTHTVISRESWYEAMDKSCGLNKPKTTLTLCGKTVSVFSIDSDFPTCEDCRMLLIDNMQWDILDE